MTATIYCFRYRRRCPHATDFEDDFEGTRKPEEIPTSDDMINNILETMRDLDDTFKNNRPLHGFLYELLAYKYGVQTVYELDDDALKEYSTDATNLNSTGSHKPSRPPFAMFHELLTYKYGVQSIYELEKDDLEELQEDIEAISEIMISPLSISKKMLTMC